MNEVKYTVIFDEVHAISLNTENTFDELAPRIYTIEYSRLGGFFLKIYKESLEIPEKIYGSVEENTDRVVQTYRDRRASTGILLTGDKGSGKSLSIAVLINKICSEIKIPVIIFNAAYSGAEFDAFINLLGECAIVIDEFGKKYSESDDEDSPQVAQAGGGHVNSNSRQGALLSLMDGLDKVKRMFVFSENSQLDINSFMLNRPSRIYYHFKFGKLEESAIQDYCFDNGVPEEKITEIVEISRNSKIFSFDILQSIVEELKRYNYSVEKTINVLNIDINSTTEKYRVVKFIKDAKEIKSITTEFDLNTNYFNIRYTCDEGDNEWTDSDCFNEQDIVYEQRNKVVFKSGNSELYAEKIPETKKTDYFSFF